jgi:hypothetical protein
MPPASPWSRSDSGDAPDHATLALVSFVIPFLNQNCIYEALILLLQGVPEKKLERFNFENICPR